MPYHPSSNNRTVLCFEVREAEKCILHIAGGVFIKEKVKGKVLPKGTRGKNLRGTLRESQDSSVLNATSFFWAKLERAAFAF